METQSKILELWEQIKTWTLWGVLEIVFFTILPTITLFLYTILNDTKDVCYFFYNEANSRGEFLLYSLALLSSAYTTSKYFKKRDNLPLIIICLILTSVLYALVAVLDQFNPTKINYCYLSIISTFMFLISIVFTYSSVKKQKEQNVDAREANENTIKKMEEALGI